MDIEKELKKKYPDKPGIEITFMRVEAFKNIFGSQANYWNWRNKKVSPKVDTLLKVCNYFGINFKNLDYEN